MKEIASGLARVAQAHPEAIILFPVHPNPVVRAAINPGLKSLPNVVLCEPLDYPQFLWCLKKAFLVISDSGGVQEEATALGKPVLVLREETERQEGIRAGALKLVGTDSVRIAREAHRLLVDARAYGRMCRASNIFGDGQAASRIVRVVRESLAGGVTPRSGAEEPAEVAAPAS